jgi:hypothetical protein
MKAEDSPGLRKGAPFADEFSIKNSSLFFGGWNRRALGGHSRRRLRHFAGIEQPSADKMFGECGETQRAFDPLSPISRYRWHWYWVSQNLSLTSPALDHVRLECCYRRTRLRSVQQSVTARQGKVMLVNFSTYTSVNRLRALPSAQSWATK